MTAGEIPLVDLQAQYKAIRAEIENGTFVTPERIHGTVERLLDVIV